MSVKIPLKKTILKMCSEFTFFNTNEKLETLIKHCIENKIQLLKNHKDWINGYITPEGIFIPCNYGCHELLREYLMRIIYNIKYDDLEKPDNVLKFENLHVKLNDSSMPPHFAPIKFRGETLTAYQKLSIHEWAKAHKWENHYEMKEKGHYRLGPDFIIDQNLQVKKEKYER